MLAVWPPILTWILSELMFLFCKLRAIPFFRIIGKIKGNRMFSIGLSWWICCFCCHFYLVSSTWSHPVLYFQIPSLNFWFLILFPKLDFLLPLCTFCMSYWYFRVFLSEIKLLSVIFLGNLLFIVCSIFRPSSQSWYLSTGLIHTSFQSVSASSSSWDSILTNTELKHPSLAFSSHCLFVCSFS